MPKTANTEEITQLQDRINAFWSWRGDSGRPGDLAIRNDQELQTWMGVLQPLLHQPTLDPALPVAREAGFRDVQITRLETIEAFVRDLEGKNMVWLVLSAQR